MECQNFHTEENDVISLNCASDDGHSSILSTTRSLQHAQSRKHCNAACKRKRKKAQMKTASNCPEIHPSFKRRFQCEPHVESALQLSTQGETQPTANPVAMVTCSKEEEENAEVERLWKKSCNLSPGEFQKKCTGFQSRNNGTSCPCPSKQNCGPENCFLTFQPSLDTHAHQDETPVVSASSSAGNRNLDQCESLGFSHNNIGQENTSDRVTSTIPQTSVSDPEMQVSTATNSMVLQQDDFLRIDNNAMTLANDASLSVDNAQTLDNANRVTSSTSGIDRMLREDNSDRRVSQIVHQRPVLTRRQLQHAAKAVVDNSINKTLEELGLSPNVDTFLVNQCQVEDEAISAAIQRQGLCCHQLDDSRTEFFLPDITGSNTLSQNAAHGSSVERTGNNTMRSSRLHLSTQLDSENTEEILQHAVSMVINTAGLLVREDI